MELMARGKFALFAYNFLMDGLISIFLAKTVFTVFQEKGLREDQGSYNNLTLMELMLLKNQERRLQV